MRKFEKIIVALLCAILIATAWTAIEVSKLVERGVEVEFIELD